ncbi:hypothetical protein EDF18_0985 [Frigoribacterium sp. PhB107]|uniref:hypothetical protein n=1 Tax=Frigoribacterium sp. PhB107 TaxID=2485172 RepID=UPI000F4726A1|nr:hypothetical protein [Frigoribacterium sp. PhB107]ROP78339.1 hypothetical protein EDF18_0985 [Frigoribacterium sp. PhB107]
MTDTPRHLAVIDERPALAELGTQIANPVRATVRTVVQALVVLIPLVNIAAGVLIDYLNTQTDLVVPAWAFLVLNGAVAVTSFVIGLVTRLMATPAVDQALTRYVPWLAALRRR